MLYRFAGAVRRAAREESFVAIVGAAWVFAMAFSRTGVHAHWFTDTVGGTLAGLGLTVASAHVSTLGPQAVDVFYVQEDGGVRPTELRAAAAAHAVRTALGG